MDTRLTTLLLVETNLSRREQLYDLFTRHHYTVLTASSTEQALELLKHERPKLILASLDPSVAHAKAWIERIRSFDSATPIIVIDAPVGGSAPTGRASCPEAVQAILHETASEPEYLDTVQRCLTASPSARHDRWPAHILIVDDEQRLRQILADFLSLRGFQVSQVGSGDEALAFLAREKPTTVLLDVSMPGMDGLLVLKKIKALYPSLHVIMITGFQEEDALDQAVALGASDYIMKPFNFDYLETALLSKLVLGKNP